MSSALDRLLALVRRELRAEDVRVITAQEAEAEADNVLHGRMHDGRILAVVFGAPPANPTALRRRLDMLLKTFAQSFDEEPISRGVRVPARSLTDELRALVRRARATEAVVIDANSPIVWGAASGVKQAEPLEREPRVSLIDVSRVGAVRDAVVADDAEAPLHGDESGPGRGSAEHSDVAARAIEAVRSLSGLATIRKGTHLRETVRRDGFACTAHSFAGIYVLVVVYEDTFDELRAERAIAEALPQVERLVLALPPLDPRPAPMAGAIAVRRRRR